MGGHAQQRDPPHEWCGPGHAQHRGHLVRVGDQDSVWGGHAPHGRPPDIIGGNITDVLTKSGDVDGNITDAMTKDMQIVGRRTLCLEKREIDGSDSQIIVNGSGSGSNSFSAADQMEKKTDPATKTLESVDDARAFIAESAENFSIKAATEKTADKTIARVAAVIKSSGCFETYTNINFEHKIIVFNSYRVIQYFS